MYSQRPGSRGGSQTFSPRGTLSWPPGGAGALQASTKSVNTLASTMGRTPKATQPSDSGATPRSQLGEKTGMASTTAMFSMTSNGALKTTPRCPTATGILEMTMRENGYTGTASPSTLPTSALPMTLADFGSITKRPLVSSMEMSTGGDSDNNSFHIPAPGKYERVRYRAIEGPLWDVFAENAHAAAARLDLKVPQKSINALLKDAKKSSNKAYVGYMPTDARNVPAVKAVTMCVLLYSAPCNPFHMGDIEVLRKAKEAVEQLPKCEVAGVMVLPHSDGKLKERNIKDKRRMPFALRQAIARSVINFAGESKWIVVDCCMQVGGSLDNAPDRPSTYIGEYARSRLQDTRWDVRVIEVRCEDPADVSESMRPLNDFFVGPHGVSEGATLGAQSTVLVGMPKQSFCDELLANAVVQAPSQAVAVVLERLCGPTAASMISEWAGTMRGRARQK